jgi:hypothetical protein
MPFDREAAKKAGYSDSEIADFLAQQPDTSAAMPQDGGGSSLAPLAIGAGAAGIGAAGAVMGGRALMRAAPRAAQVVGKAIARRVPGVGEAMDAVDVMKELRGPQAASSPRAVEKIPSGWTTVSAEDAAKFPELEHYNPGDPISLKRLEQIRTVTNTKPDAPLPGTVKARAAKPTKVTPIRSNPRAPGPTIQDDKIAPAPPPGQTEAGNPQQGRFGQSKPGAPVREGNIIRGPGAGTAEEAAAARQAFLLERQAARAGVSAADREALMAGLKGIGGPAMQVLVTLLGAQDTNAQIDAAHQAAMTPTMRRATAGYPQGI